MKKMSLDMIAISHSIVAVIGPRSDEARPAASNKETQRDDT